MLSDQVGKKQFVQDVVDLRIASLEDEQPVPKYVLPKKSMLSEVAYRIVHQEMLLDGNPVLNLASFVTTSMDEKALQLMQENINKNYVDHDQYPQTTEIQNRCINMLATLYHAPDGGSATGTATIGSSEAIHLAGLALKWKWRKHHEELGLPTHKPNIIMCRNVQICWVKFARYFDVEPRFVDVQPGNYVLNVEEAMKLVDENTICVVGILGTTLTGEYEPIEELNHALEKLNTENNWEVPIHVDAASGGFVAPFVTPKLRWDFRLKWVFSINVSGHKYGLVYPGVGWIVWRNKAHLPEDLIFNINYLGRDEATFNLNFSKNASNIIAQYYNFIRFGEDGYRRVMERLLTISDYITDSIEEMGIFDVVSKKGSLPMVCCKLKEESGYSVFDISEKLRERRWIVPAYTMPENAEHVSVFRAVIRQGFSRDLADLFLRDLKRVIEKLAVRCPIEGGKPREADSDNSNQTVC